MTRTARALEHAPGVGADTRIAVIYCGVSTHKQLGNLTGAITEMQSKHSHCEIITDVGTEATFYRPGIKQILELVLSQNLREIIVGDENWMPRLGHDLFKVLGQIQGFKVTIAGDRPVPTYQTPFNTTNPIIAPRQGRVPRTNQSGRGLRVSTPANGGTKM